MNSAYERASIEKAIKEKVKVVIYTSNGFQMKGKIKFQDDRVIIVEVKDEFTTMVYKTAISTIEFVNMDMSEINVHN